jgi:hypothetical protein
MPQMLQVGDNVTISCHTKVDQEVEWKHIRETGVQLDEYIIYSNGVIYEGFRERFSITKDASVPTVVNLVISVVEISDAGRYTCTENEGFGIVHETHLVVSAATTTSTIVLFRSTGKRATQEPQGTTNLNLVSADEHVFFLCLLLVAMLFLLMLARVLKYLIRRKAKLHSCVGTQLSEDAEVTSLLSSLDEGASGHSMILKITNFIWNPRLRDRLVDIIEPDYGLLDELLSQDVLTRREFADITAKVTVYMRNQCLLAVLSQKSSKLLIGRFLLALKNVGQSHIVNYIRHADDNELADTKDVDRLPVADENLLKLTHAFPRLVSMIPEDHSLTCELYSVGCINQQQLEDLDVTMNRADRVRKVLLMLMRRSEGDFRNFVRALKKCGMEHCAEFLQNGQSKCLELCSSKESCKLLGPSPAMAMECTDKTFPVISISQ